MSEWKEYRLGDLIMMNQQSIGRNYAFNTIQYLDTGSITKGKIDSLQEYLLIDAPSRAKRLVNESDIIYSTVRPIQRHYGYITNPPENLVVSTGFAVISTIKKKADSLFVYYFLSSNEVVNYLDMVAEGATSAYPSLTPDVIADMDVIFPDLPEQKAIASILSSLDDKIELLQNQNKTLEEFAETLYRQWFIEDNNSIESVFLNEYVNCINGVSYKSSELNTSKTALVSLKSFNRYGGFNLDGFKDFTGRYKEQQVVKEGDLVVAHTDITQEAEVIGNPALIISSPKYDILVISMDMVKVTPKVDWISTEFLYFLMRSREFKHHCLGCANGTTVLHLNKEAIPTFGFPKPEKEKVMAFTQLASGLIQKIFINHKELSNLISLRDSLIPKLMSGDLKVK
jgi:Restriction endonuclease S subunits